MTESIFSFITLFTPHKQAKQESSISYQPHRDSPVANAINFFSDFFLLRSTSMRKTATCVDT
jgi:hypothetical protein